jgi:hypothetical protein
MLRLQQLRRLSLRLRSGREACCSRGEGWSTGIAHVEILRLSGETLLLIFPRVGHGVGDARVEVSLRGRQACVPACDRDGGGLRCHGKEKKGYLGEGRVESLRDGRSGGGCLCKGPNSILAGQNAFAWAASRRRRSGWRVVTQRPRCLAFARRSHKHFCHQVSVWKRNYGQVQTNSLPFTPLSNYTAFPWMTCNPKPEYSKPTCALASYPSTWRSYWER